MSCRGLSDYRLSHETFAEEAVNFFQQYFEYKPRENTRFIRMTKSAGDAIITIAYLFRYETWKMCRDIREYLIVPDNFETYCKCIRVDNDGRFFYNYLRRVSLILQMASFCYMKGHDFFRKAIRCIYMYEAREIETFYEEGSWLKFNEVAEFIGECGDRLLMVMLKEHPSKKPKRFIDAIAKLEPKYTRSSSSYADCFAYIVEIKWKLVEDNNIGSLPDHQIDDPESSSSSEGDDQNPPDGSSRAPPSKVARSARDSRSKSVELPRPSTSREKATRSKKVKHSKSDKLKQQKAILKYFLKCCTRRRKKFGHLGGSSVSETSSAASLSAESEAENVLEYDSDGELANTSIFQLVEKRRKRLREDRSPVQRQKGASTSAVAEQEPHCSVGKKRKLINEPRYRIFTIETSSSDEESE